MFSMLGKGIYELECPTKMNIITLTIGEIDNEPSSEEEMEKKKEKVGLNVLKGDWLMIRRLLGCKKCWMNLKRKYFPHYMFHLTENMFTCN